MSDKSWSSRLIRYIFGVNPKSFTNLCPYFWLAVGGILLTPFKVFWDFISWPRRRLKRGSYQRFLRSLRKSDLYYLKYHPHKGKDYFYEKISLRYVRKPDHEILEDALKEKGISEKEVDGYENYFEEDLKRAEERTKNFNKISRIFEKIGLTWIALNILLLGLIATTGIIHGIYYFSILTPTYYLFMLAFFCFLALVTLYFKGYEVAYDLLEKYKDLKWYQYLYSIPLWIITSPLLITTGVMVFVWNVIIVKGIWKNGILKFGGIFGKYLEAAYKNYCPGIEWEEKGGEI